MHSDKSPRPDGLNPAFYQRFWGIIGEDVTKACLSFLQSSSFPDGLNDTFIALIPKKNCPEVVSNLHPISLCNVLYKVVAKMLANILKLVLPHLIADYQSVFIPGRLITDNIMVAYEVVHYLKRKRQGKEGYAALKVDMSKAYDRLEWDFLEQVMRRMRFPEKWIGWMVMCITSVKFSIVHYCHDTDSFFPTRGLRQGYPLSPYLFILCAKGFSALLKNSEDRGLIHGCRIVRGAPIISHLFFADDSFLFFRDNLRESQCIKDCISLYEKASGQQINFQKSSISFSSNSSRLIINQICSLLDVQQTENHGKYLGLPSLIGRNKSQIFSFIKEKLWSRLQGWKKCFLSRAGKEILVKTVAQALPTFAMRVFLLPLELCAELERIMNSFWWGTGHGGSKGIHWMRWDRLCASKQNGGLGFRKIHEFNLSLLGKNGWRLLNQPASLMAIVYKARYYPNSTFF
ncbi:hypothetical protein Ddye_031500 [Dipteronia dyeriana]|uniref:Reverse transcriptase domain-containing protein n=1 Tax=Dipteronia dyeriana TaxID=168575 RepID=A0AAD9WNQ6_9ROSI|nr:hypothetical protein Ddye_031500 [Dipteronia dyeriana]